MDRCWLNPASDRRKRPNVKIDPAFRGQNYCGQTDDDGLDSDGQVIEEYDSPEKCLCLFTNEDAAEAILHPRKGVFLSTMSKSRTGGLIRCTERDPSTHEGCLMIEARSGTSLPIAHSEMYNLQASRNPYIAKKWKALCENYRAKSRRASVLGNIRSSFA